jgi:hypothetical protein
MTFPCWLFENLDCSGKFSTSTISTWLEGKELMLQDCRGSWQGTNWSSIPNRPFTRKGKLMTEFRKLLCERWLQGVISRNNLAHTFTYFANFEVLTTRCFESAALFQSWCNAYACAVWCSWCTLEWLGYPCALMIGNAINSREGICVTSCYLTTKIPSALLGQSCGCSTHDTLGSVAAPLTMR